MTHERKWKRGWKTPQPLRGLPPYKAGLFFIHPILAFYKEISSCKLTSPFLNQRIDFI